MSAPRPPEPAAPEPPQPAVVEWGPASGDRFSRWRRVDPRLPRLLGSLGALALFGSLVGEWQVASWSLGRQFGEPASQQELTGGLATLGSWTAGWLVGLLLLLVCAALALLGEQPLRRYARTVGLAVAGVQAGLLVAIAVDLRRHSWFGPVESMIITGVDGPQPELAWGRGLYAAGAGLLLTGAALWLARTGQPIAVGQPGAPAGGHPATAAGDPAAAAPATAAPAAGQPPDSPAEPAVGPPPSGYAGPVSYGPPEAHGSAVHDRGPPDLAVGPADPFTGPADGYEWR